MCRLSVGDTDAPVGSNDDEPGDPLVLEGTSDQGYQAGIQQWVGNATHSQCEGEWPGKASRLEGDGVQLKFPLNPGTPVRIIHIYS